MKTTQNLITLRQKYYWEGRNLQEQGQLLEAIEAFKIYASYLPEEDQHIPQQWISELYDHVGENEQALIHLEAFARGCSPPRAAEVYKAIGEKYLSIHSVEKAISSFEKAIENNPNIGIKKKLEELKSRPR